jgi:hypothetical protein
MGRLNPMWPGRIPSLLFFHPLFHALNVCFLPLECHSEPTNAMLLIIIPFLTFTAPLLRARTSDAPLS